MAAMIPLAICAGQSPVQKILFVGDSITRHSPDLSIGWKGDWGMAASAKEKDYVHLFLARLTAAQGGKMPELLVAAEGGGKLPGQVAQCDRFKAFDADVAVVQMGENDNTDVSEAGFQRPYEKILEAIKAGNPQARIFCFGVWSPNGADLSKDAMIQAAGEKVGAVFVDLNAVNDEPANTAGSEKRFTHPGVNWHPGDRGMQAYADALWQAWTGAGQTSRPRRLATGAVTELINEKWDGKSEIKWTPVPTAENGVLKLSVDKAATDASFETDLPVSRCVGRRLIVETRVRGENLSPKPNLWNGVKLMLILQNAEGKTDYPQAEIPVGSFDWKPVRWVCRVPDNIVSAKLRLGLEQVTGSVWFEPLKISVVN